MVDERALIPFKDNKYYQQYFCDLTVWEPYVREVAGRMGVTPQTIRATNPGTFPVFNIDNRLVVKFFGELFDGGSAFEIETTANRMIEGLQGMDVPRVLVEGALYKTNAEWPWPYLVFEYLPGCSFGKVRDQISDVSKQMLAVELGRWVRKLHALILPTVGPLAEDQQAWAAFLASQISDCKHRHMQWKSLPDHLIEQIDGYLPSLDFLLDESGPLVLTHADLTGDHILGILDGDEWITSGLIDLGDARPASRFYELPALFFDLFKCDTQLLIGFIQSYGASLFHTQDFPRLALSYALLHQFNVFARLYEDVPLARSASSLDELAYILFGFVP
ncbi:MAG: aminoglycoside phosphotransferase family protein [Anaerolineaceae bacterium]|nr:aminoglycoside phosphotransferase family protein [Anaerolineaceae bacterium]